MTQADGNFGKPVSFVVGDTIYKQGSESAGIYMLLDGRVEIWRHDGDDAHHLASIGAGELLGEVSVIERSRHSVTAKVSEATNALFIDAESFRRSFADPLVRHVVNTLASRLRSSYAITKSIMNERGDDAAICKSDHATLEGISRLVADKLLTYIELKEFPFTISNFTSKAAHSVATPNALKIPLPGIRELSDNHFEVVKRDGELYVRDLGSPHGTLVNGEALSRYSMNAIAKLKIGRNEVVAGGPDSPVRFAITLPQKI
tara:strand:+ start:336 stop:1115 length:780 start_codon:yes stop_codon:yes gene_type:complete